jgi:hypothetical protein
MKAKRIISILLITVGIVILACAEITFTTPVAMIHFLSLRTETADTHCVLPMAGAFSLIGGIVLLPLKSIGMIRRGLRGSPCFVVPLG